MVVTSSSSVSGLTAAWRWALAPPWRYVPPSLALAVIAVEMLAAVLPRFLGGLLILVSMLALWALLFTLASRLLLLRAAGVRRMRQAASVDLPPGIAVRHTVLWVLASLLLALIHGGTGLAGLVPASLVLALILPGATMVLSAGQSLSDALYPPEWLQNLRRLGVVDYLVLSAWLAVYALIYLVVSGVLADAPGWLRNALQMTWWSAGLLAWFAHVGLLLHAHRQTDDRAAPPPSNVPSVDDPVALFEHVLRNGGDASLHRKLARTLEAAGEDRRALIHGQVHVQALVLTFERPTEALEQADRLLALDPRFSLDDPVVMRHLIQTAGRLGTPELVARLCRNYLARFPGSLVAADIRLTACEALADAGRLNTQQARDWLDALADDDLDAAQARRLERLWQDVSRSVRQDQ
ncbi:MAG: hypothetical protein EA419_09215 [Wenzhouxiangella sp.]|nr:MAG: hypothetical protein EA419_09215 [Wenzhouxiangella sp.]